MNDLPWKGGDKQMAKQSSDKTSALAAKVLSGAKKPTAKEAKTLAASVLSQDETKGKRSR
ncbi:MAG: hypothetical protein LBK99_05745 [Opitutaceae bacterium]|jgi:hypothetical protein|nr:hypothetical protein [Opitutaceae bacterium]